MSEPYVKRKDVFVIGDNITSPIGDTTAENMHGLMNNKTGVRQYDDEQIISQPFAASLFATGRSFIAGDHQYTKFEQLLIASITDAIMDLPNIATNPRTVLIISSTKGNISLLETEARDAVLYERIALHTSAKMVADHFGFVHAPVIISNACISGIWATIAGMRYLQTGAYDHAVVVGADVISKFVLSGFGSFQALSATICKPFDKSRTGINLGEAAATMVLSVAAQNEHNIRILSGAVSNDANHISGPSRTGEELAFAIKRSMNDAGLSKDDISFISAHGTATLYNDEMEANAINIAGLQAVPVNSLKGYYGHTLGAAGLVEAVVSLHSLQQDLVLPTPGFETMGVTQPINVAATSLHKPLQYCLKTASGFGGCNAALIIGK